MHAASGQTRRYRGDTLIFFDSMANRSLDMNTPEIFLADINWTQWQSQKYKLFALLDCAHVSADSWRTLHQQSPNVVRRLFEGTPDEGLSSVEPLLVDALHPDAAGIMSWLSKHHTAYPMVLWLACPRSIGDLHTQLRPRLKADLPDAPDALLRFYDPRVFGKLMQVLQPGQQALFFTVARHWWAWDARAGVLRAYTATDAHSHSTSHMSLSPEQMQRFGELDVADFVHDLQTHLLKAQPPLQHVQGLRAEALHQQVQSHVDKAQRFGFETEDNIKAYVLCVAASLGWAFDQGGHDRVVALLTDQRPDEDTKLQQLQAHCATLQNTADT
jgi:hypothetical protein